MCGHTVMAAEVEAEKKGAREKGVLTIGLIYLRIGPDPGDWCGGGGLVTICTHPQFQ